MKKFAIKHTARAFAIFVIFLVGITTSTNAIASSFPDEILHYVISYKWGLIHKDAGDATLSLHNSGNNYHMKLTAKTRPWADRFYSVRDTLFASATKAGFRPIKYEKITHEKGKYAKDIITYSYSGGYINGKAVKYRPDDNGRLTARTTNLKTAGKAFDMLSVFYYLRLIDYASLKKGETIQTSVFSGSKTESLTIKYVGTEDISMRDKTKRKAYHIKFRFTSKGKKKSSEDIDTWISVETPHIPLLLTGSLPVGQVRCHYIGGR